jgi:hypothetical protein
MITILFILLIIGLCKIPALIRHERRRMARNRPATRQDTTPAKTTPATRTTATADSLQRQRDIICDMISDIDNQLDNAPPDRIKLLNQQATLYGKLATVESKLARLYN